MENKINDELCYRSLEGDEAKIFFKVNNLFRSIVMQQDAKEYQIPAMISKSVLDKCNYFSSFPQQLTVSAFVDEECYKEVMDTKEIVTNQVKVNQMYLTPSACLHLYPMLSGKNLENSIHTTCARVYRYEDQRFNGSTRLWDFTVREVVFVGAEEFINQSMEKMKEITMLVAERFGLPLELRKASDSFYPSPENRMKGRIQKSNNLKFELTVSIGESDVAIGSFNYHLDHFSKPFHFDQNGTVVSACIGYGLERWLAAIKEYNAEEKVLSFDVEAFLEEVKGM